MTKKKRVDTYKHSDIVIDRLCYDQNVAAKSKTALYNVVIE